MVQIFSKKSRSQDNVLYITSNSKIRLEGRINGLVNSERCGKEVETVSSQLTYCMFTFKNLSCFASHHVYV